MSPTSTTLRPATVADAGVALSWSPTPEGLRKWAGPTARWPATAESFWNDINNADATTFALETPEDGLVGIGQVRHREQKYGHLARIIVSPDRRGRGFGRALCVALMREAPRLHSIAGYSLYVYQDNANAIGLYRSLGYVASGTHPQYPDMLLMLAPVAQGGQSTGPRAMRILRLQTFGRQEIQGLSEVLIDCVEGGASVSFLLPLAQAKADAFWQATAASALKGERVVIVALDSAGAIVGTVQVILAQPENQPHRGDVAKMLVHRRARRNGVGAALLAAAEQAAVRAGKTLLVLDTVTGSEGERLYLRQGWQRCGEIPDYALWPDGRPCATTIFFKSLA